MSNRKIKYLIRSLSNTIQNKECPNCGSKDLKRIDRKYLITSLLKCNECCLNHRHPKDSAKWLEKFYQTEYKIDTHMMTDLPTDAEIKIQKQENFSSLRNESIYISALFNSKPIKLIDYGCSWGYNVFKLLNDGHNAVGYELSVPRALFGEEKLGVKIFSKLEQLPVEQDLMLSSHVIEHLVDLPKFFQFSKVHLKNDGVFMAFCPNGTAEYRTREPETWHGSWGDIHVNLIDVEFAKLAFKDNPYLILTGDWAFDPKEIEEWDGMSQKVGAKKDGKELLIIAKPTISIS
ncbi:MAG: hypothetical protein ACI865_000181 [Flavobacteriaceae bacterium]|jgi:hypothetical protein